MSNTVHAVGSEITGGVVVATTQARCNKKNVQSGMTISSNWEDVTCGSCLKTYVRHDGRKNSPLTLLEYEHEYVTKVGELEEQERLSICCGADEDENIENMCSACHESTTFFKVFGPEKEEEEETNNRGHGVKKSHITVGNSEDGTLREIPVNDIVWTHRGWFTKSDKRFIAGKLFDLLGQGKGNMA